jgi:transcriptional regulator with XRE-family HTH domain
MRRRRLYPSLKKWRHAQDFSTREAAAYLRTSQPTYSRVERGVQAPNRKVLATWIEKTGVPLENIMGIAS